MNIKNQTTLLQSMQFANWAHRNQKNKMNDAPYIVNPFHVRWLLATHGLDPDIDENVPVFIAGDNHNAVEDNPEEVTFELIEAQFGAEAARIVKGVTLDPKNPDKQLSRDKILASDWKIKIVKVADVLSNTMSLVLAIEKFGFEEVQKHFKMAIYDRFTMEIRFINAIPHNEHACLGALAKSATLALWQLETVARE